MSSSKPLLPVLLITMTRAQARKQRDYCSADLPSTLSSSDGV